MTDAFQVPPYDDLIADYKTDKKKNSNHKGIFLEFKVSEIYGDACLLDIYNASPVDKEQIIARVEEYGKEAPSASVLFSKVEENKYENDGFKIDNFQDPGVKIIKDETVLRGVEVYPEGKNKLGYSTAFYKGEDIKKLKKVAKVPKMKDLTAVELMNEDAIGLFTRPEISVPERKYPVKEIGFIKIDSIDEINNDTIRKAKTVIKFAEDEWGGINNAYYHNGEILCLMHIAKSGNLDATKHYCAAVCVFEPETNKVSNLEVIATREDFPDGSVKRIPGKNPDFLRDIVFPTALERYNGEVNLYAGVSDAMVGKKPVTLSKKLRRMLPK